MANVKVGKKGLTVLLIVLIVIGLGVGLFLILRPKPDLNAPYNDTYELVHSDSLAYVQKGNKNIKDALIEKEADLQSIETYSQTKAKITVYNNVSEILSTLNTTYLDNLKFTENKGDNMANLQQDIKKNYAELKENIESCKTYIETYLTKNQINQYNSESLYQKIYNYKYLYEKLIDSQTKYYEYMSQIFAEYLTDTVMVNRYSKIAVQTTASWARKITEYYLSYKQEDMTQYDFENALSRLNNFANVRSLENTKYINQKENCDKIADDFAKVNFDECVNALATYTYETYTTSLEGETRDSAIALKTYFLV